MVVSGYWDEVRQSAGDLMMGALWLRELDEYTKAENWP